MRTEFSSEAALSEAAGRAARAWRDGGIDRLGIGLNGPLGVGKTSFARALLRGLGHAGRVPSPTYTLLEHYELDGLTVVHLDLYRLNAPLELENLGLRDWLSLPRVWILAEWPERSPAFAAALDVGLALSAGADSGADEQRQLVATAHNASGRRALELWLGPDIN